jgi:hypothetical protein
VNSVGFAAIMLDGMVGMDREDEILDVWHAVKTG